MQSTLEIRRHSWRKTGGGSQLSQRGVDLARSVGASMGPFDRVVASVVPRARETALAMGFAVHEEIVTLASDPEMYDEATRHRWWEHPAPFESLARLIAIGGASRRYAHSLAALWRDYLTPSDVKSVLVIGHSGELEYGLVACLPFADHRLWGAPFGPCEGARLTFVGEPPRFVDVAMIRVVDPADSDAAESVATATTGGGPP